MRIGKGWKRGAMAVGAPLIFFTAVEALLAILGLFAPVRLLQRTTWDGQVFLYTNPGFGRLYFPRKEIPMPSPIWVRAEKEPGVLRVVLLGESAAAGFPHPEFNLARTVEHLWGHRFPGQRIEVVNLTMVGVNSHILRRFALEALELKPDAFILYAGHNEVIGPFGPASVFGRPFASLGLIRGSIWIRNTRVGRALESAYRALAARWGHKMPRWSGLDEFAAVRMAYDDPRLATLARHTERNFRDLVEHATRNGVPVLVCVPGVNLTDWPPVASTPETLDDESALAAWFNGNRGELTSAAQVYRLAKRLEQFGDRLSAWPLYRLALDLDLYRFRADSRTRAALLSLRNIQSTTPVAVVDIDRLLHEENPSFRSDRDYFCEHVHLTFAGRAQVAAIMIDALSSLLGLRASEDNGTLNVGDLAVQMLFTPMDEMILWQSVRELLTLTVFAEQPEADQRQAEIEQLVQELHAASRTWSVDLIAQKYEAARRANPNDPMLDSIAGRHFGAAGDSARAVVALERAAARMPSHVLGQILLAQHLMGLGRFSEAETHLSLAERYSIEMTRILILRGELNARTGRYPLARKYLSNALAAIPNHYNSMVNLALVHFMMGESDAARELYAKCIETRPTDVPVLNNYAWLLALAEGTTPSQRRQALPLVQRALALQPGYAPLQKTLILALAADGQFEEARLRAERVVADAVAAGEVGGVTNLIRALAQHGITLTNPD